MIELPAAFLARMQTLLGSAYDDFLRAFDAPGQRGLRVNLQKCTEDAFLASCCSLPLRKTSYGTACYCLDCADVGTGNLPQHHAGMFYLQEPSAMIPVAAGCLKRGDFVLDVCAAPGGKSTQIADCIGPEGLLCANEFVPSRAKVLLSNIERLGIRNAVVTNTDAAHLRTWYEGCFDAVLVDAPCSGEGMFRKNPQAVGEWSEENVAMCAERSYGILCDAEVCLRPGGTLIYSTCTYAPEENEYLIARFLASHPDYTVSILPDAVRRVTVPGIRAEGCAQDTSRSARCYPHVTDGEGQFVCVLRKAGDAPRREIRDTLAPLSKAEASAVGAFLKENFRNASAIHVKKYKEMLVVVPEQLKAGGTCFSCGVPLGENKGGRIVPHHNLFSAYGTQMKRTWNFPHDDKRVLQYLHGETVALTAEEQAASGDGFGCFLVDGCPLGGAKNVGGTLKNHYPKGLRAQGIL